MLLCESIVEHMLSLAVGLRRIEIGIRLSACGVKNWILVSAQISERLFIEENALQFTVVGQQELSRERLQFPHSSNLHIRPQILCSLPWMRGIWPPLDPPDSGTSALDTRVNFHGILPISGYPEAEVPCF